ncbi:Rad4-related protein [Cryptosporidium ubiquitum]|uniref:Rad4-related protein n=1 Tax=Cryptosporidium ubiquitum TaxID=857276 RepID=A0A1J4MFP3_9CRYT|nr:Rad4-related protein [Cryptosporidium ubiquitum]OII73048.1 Rad4-related protein [Cryptosporidium ubiquitum]
MQRTKNDTRLAYILGWLIHLRFLNRIVDNIFIKSHILSLYLYYNQEYDKRESIREIYQWFRKYFKTYYLPNEYWIYKLHAFESKKNNLFSKSDWMNIYYSLFSNESKELILDSSNTARDEIGRVETNLFEKFQEINKLFIPSVNQHSFFLGKILRRILSSILSGKCSAEASNILFATLLRSLGYYCRLTLFIPPIINFKKSCELQSNDRRAELWVEIFEPSFNKWISVDIHRGGWNFTGCNTKIPFVAVSEDRNFSNEYKSNKGLFSKLYLNDFNDDSDDSNNEGSNFKKMKPIPIIPLKKKSEVNHRAIKYEISNVVEQEEQRESLAFEFSNKKKIESLSLFQLQCKIDMSRTNIKYKINDNIGWWVISVNEHGYLKETTSRYVSDWSQVFQAQLKNSCKQKIDFLISTINSTSSKYSSRLIQLELLDDFELEKIIHENDVIPISKTSFKNHPKYAIISCLNSLEIVHPKEPIVGYFQGEPIYLRENVQTLKTRTQWDQEQREIKIDQQPIKIIFKKKNGNDSLKGKIKLEYFAEFQTQIKPLVELNHLDKIPRDNFKSIDISIKGNIPDSCVHIKDSCEGLKNNKFIYISRYFSTWKTENIIDIIKRSNIDYARAFVGYDYKNGSKPKYDGIIIKKKDVILLQSLKKRHELININKMANFIWNDILQSIKDVLNCLSQNSSSNSFNKNCDSILGPKKDQKLINFKSNFSKIRSISERLLEESYKAIDRKKEETNRCIEDK